MAKTDVVTSAVKDLFIGTKKKKRKKKKKGSYSRLAKKIIRSKVV